MSIGRLAAISVYGRGSSFYEYPVYYVLVKAQIREKLLGLASNTLPAADPDFIV